MSNLREKTIDAENKIFDALMKHRKAVLNEDWAQVTLEIAIALGISCKHRKHGVPCGNDTRARGYCHGHYCKVYRKVRVDDEEG